MAGRPSSPIAAIDDVSGCCGGGNGGSGSGCCDSGSEDGLVDDNDQFREQRAVRVIQRYYRGYKLRKDFERMRTDKRCSKRLDLGMLQQQHCHHQTHLPASESAAAAATADLSDSAVDVTATSSDLGSLDHPLHQQLSQQQQHNRRKCQQHQRHNSLDDILVGNDEAFLAWQRSLLPASGQSQQQQQQQQPQQGDSPGQDSGVYSSEHLAASLMSSTPPLSSSAAAGSRSQHQPQLVKRCHSCTAAAAAAAVAALKSPPMSAPPVVRPNAGLPAASSASPTSVAIGNGGPQQALVSSCRQHQTAQPSATYAHYSHNDRVRKRTYRIGLNFFNRKPEKGIQFLMAHHFIQNSPSAVARFLLHRKGLCKQVISNYLGQCHASSFVNRVCEYFLNDFDFTNKPLDIALREFLQFIEVKGEAQVVSRILEKFANRYIACNSSWINEKFVDSDVIHLLVFAVMMLNTDLHNMNNKRKITMREFIHNLRGCDSGNDLADSQMLADLYERIRAEPLRAGSDHVTQVLKMEAQLYGRHPSLAEPHRRLVCFCKLTLVKEWKSQRPKQSERAVFLFNDLLIVTKCLERKRRVFYQYRGSLGLHRMQVSFSVPDNLQVSYPIHIVADPEGCDLDAAGGCHHDMVFSARNFHDRSRFCDDLVESIHEVGDMRRYERSLFPEHGQHHQPHHHQQQQHHHQHSQQHPRKQPSSCHHPQSVRRQRSSGSGGDKA